MNDIQHMVALTALNNLLREKHFSICTLDRVAEMLGVQPQAEAYRTLRPLHCIDYAVMPQELRNKIPDLIRECLGIIPMAQFTDLRPQLHVEVTEPKRGGLLRLLTRS